MTIRVKIPTQLRELAGGKSEVEVEAAGDLRQILKEVGGAHPGLLERVLDDQGEIRRFVNVYVGDEDVRFIDGLDTKVSADDVVSILPAVAGGR